MKSYSVNEDDTTVGDLVLKKGTIVMAEVPRWDIKNLDTIVDVVVGNDHVSVIIPISKGIVYKRTVGMDYFNNRFKIFGV